MQGREDGQGTNDPVRHTAGHFAYPSPMTTHLALELLGYLASLLIATSLMMRSIVRLRVINLAGAATFSIYGFLIGAYPVGLLNLLTASINVVQLVRLRKRREIFRILEVRPDSEYLEHFLDFEGGEIRRFMPGFRFDPNAVNLVLFVLRDLVPAGLLIGTTEDGALTVRLDYAVAQYRDLKIGNFLFADQAEFFRSRGVREILSPSGTEEHWKYLERMGYEKVEDGETYRLRI